MPADAPRRDPQITIELPELCLVLLVGAAGSGKSTFARRHFRPTEVLSSDYFRGLVSDDEANQGASGDAFAVLHLVASLRLARGRLTVIDATNLRREARKPLLELARRHHVQAAAIVFDLPAELVQEQNRGRSERVVDPLVVADHAAALPAVLEALRQEGVEPVAVLSSRAEVESVRVVRRRLPVNRRDEPGPFDLVGDVHGCFAELLALLFRLGYRVACHTDGTGRRQYRVSHPQGRRVVFVGDLVDRGPAVAEVLRLALDMADAGAALCVLGNHDDKLRRKLSGRDVKLTHGLAETLAQLGREPPEFVERVKHFLDGLAPHYVLDRGKLVVAHAGLRKELQGRVSGAARSFALFGDTTGENDEYGLTIRRDWAADYRGRALVVYGHTPVQQAQWRHNTINIDTGCVFGGRLTALRYPEGELVSVPAAARYAESARPLLPPFETPATGHVFGAGILDDETEP